MSANLARKTGQSNLVEAFKVCAQGVCLVDMEDAILASLDVRDAFLTVKQECPTLVHITDAGGNVKTLHWVESCLRNVVVVQNHHKLLPEA